MKIAPKLILCAALSLLIGIAVAAPLLANELNIRPWTTHIQGPTAPFDLDVVYANFTVQNPDAPFTKTSGPTINYFAVVNVTNPSEYPALLLGVDFWAGQKVTNTTNQAPFGVTGNWSVGEGWEAKGAWVDGVWYNVTWVGNYYPFFDENGTMSQSPFQESAPKGYWMEGVQVYQRTVHNDAGTTTYTYLNMNGTWIDVTGRITVDKAQNGPTYSMQGSLAQKNVFFQPVSMRDENISNNGGWSYTSTTDVWAGEGAFNNHFAPGESRLIAVYGSWEALQYSVDVNPVDTLQAGSIDFKTMAHTDVDMNHELGNNTILDLWADPTVIQHVSLTHIGNSYIYNAALSDNQAFQLDQYGAEAFITQGS